MDMLSELPISPGLLFGLIILGIVIKGLVIERLGSFHRVLESGINIMISFIEQLRATRIIRYRKTGESYNAVTSDEFRIDQRETSSTSPASR